jgi:hypothetical protein
MQPSQITPVNVLSISFVNTPDNLALPTNQRQVVVAYSNGQHQVISQDKLNKQINSINKQTSDLVIALGNANKVMDAITSLIGSQAPAPSPIPPEVPAESPTSTT